MKKISFVLLIGILSLSINAQVVLEKKYNYSTSIVKLETLGYKYYLMDVPNEQCRIYNLDHSLFKTINCNIPNNYYLADIKYVSENLFDNDAGIEIVCTYYRYYTTQQYYEYESKVINDDGSALTTIDGARYMYVNETSDNVYKLFAYCFDYSIFPETVWTNIYGLPGTPVSSSLLDNKPETWINAYPNPAQNSVRVDYQLPENIQSGVLNLLDNSGRTIHTFEVDTHTDHLLLNVNDYPNGMYHYFIEFGNSRTPSKKLIIK